MTTPTGAPGSGVAAAANAVASSAASSGAKGAGGRPSMTSTQAKIAEKQASAKVQVLPGANKRIAARREAAAKVDAEEIGRQMGEWRSKRAPVNPGDVEITDEHAPVENQQAQQGAPRDEHGRFAKRTPPSPEVDPADAAEPAPPSGAEVDPAPDGDPEGEGDGVIPERYRPHVEAIEKRATEAETKLRQGSELANERIADISLERDHYKGLFESFRALVRKQFKVDVDPIALQLAQQRLENARYKRGADKRTAEQTSAKVAELTQQHTTRFQAVIKAHPELDPNPRQGDVDDTRVQAAKEFWRVRTQVPEGATALPDLSTLESDAAAYARLLRARADAALEQKRQQAAPKAPETRERPASNVVRGGGGSTGRAATNMQPKQAAERVSDANIHSHMAQFRMVRGGRG